MLATIVLGVLVVLLVRDNRRLREELGAAGKALIEERTKDSLAVGQAVTPVTMVGADGQVSRAAFDGDRWTMLFMVAGHCPYCEETVPIWSRLLKETQAEGNPRLSLVCIQSDAKSAAELKQLPAPLTAKVVQNERSWLSRVPIVPSVLLIDNHAVIRRAWFGVPTDMDEQAMRRVLLGGDME